MHDWFSRRDELQVSGRLCLMQCTERGMEEGVHWVVGGVKGGLIPMSRFPSVGELLPCHNKLATVAVAPLKNNQNTPSSLSLKFLVRMAAQVIMALLLCVCIVAGKQFQ